MIQTAIIAFILIGAMFVFTECGSDEEVVAKTELDKDGIPKYVTDKSKDIAYNDRDKEIAMASYVAKEQNGTDAQKGEKKLTIKSAEHYKLAKDKPDDTIETSTSYTPRDKEITLASYGVNNRVEEHTVSDESAVKESVVPKVTAAIAAVATAVVVSKVKGNDDVQNITIPDIPEVPEVPKVKSMEEFASNSSMKAALKDERLKEKGLEEELTLAQNMVLEGEQKIIANNEKTAQELQSLLAEKASLEKELVGKSNTQMAVREENRALRLKIDELLRIAEDGTSKAAEEYKVIMAKMQGLLSSKESLEANLSMGVAHEDELKATNKELILKVNELLAIAEDGASKAEAAYLLEKKELEGMEANLTAGAENEKILVEENIGLQAKIAELLSIAEEGTKRAIAKHDVEEQKMQGLLSTKANLEAVNGELAGKITELLSIAEAGTAKAEAAYAEEQQSMLGLLSSKSGLEENLTAEIEKEKVLAENNTLLQAKITELLSIAEVATQKATAEHNATEVEMQGLLSTKEGLEANLTAELEKEKALAEENTNLKAELEKIAIETEEKLAAEHNATEVEMQGLLSTKESLEANLTAELEKEKVLAEENLHLKEQLAAIAAEAEAKAAEEAAKAEEEAKAAEEAAKAEAEAKAAEEAAKAEEEAKAAEEAAKAEAEAKAAEEAAKAEEEAKAAEEAAKAEAEAKAAEEAAKAEEEAKAAEEAAKAEEEAKAAEEAAKAEEEAKAAEEAAKAEAEAKAAEEAAKAEEEAKAAEEAAKAEEEAKAAEEAAKAEAEAKAAEEAAKAEAEAKAAEEAAKAEAEAKAAEEAAKAEAEAKAAEEAAKAEAEAKAAEEAAKAEAEAKAAEEAAKAEAEAKAAEEAAKAEAEAKAAEEAAKAEAEAKAAEEAAKAEAEAKAAEEAAKAEAEAKAAEEAAKAEAEAKAAEEAAKKEAEQAAEKKLSDAFSLTQVEFKTGSAMLTTQSKSRLNQAVTVMKRYEGYRYKIQGHTDNQGGESLNLSLSKKRASAVKSYLISKGISGSILSAEGFGSSQPIASNDTREGRNQNRRVVFEVVR